jgi:hypothetical protein
MAVNEGQQLFSVAGEHSGNSSGGAEVRPRIFVTPLARKLAQERGLNLVHIRGSGPRGRIVATDVQPVPEQEPRRSERIQTSALGVEFSLVPIETMLDAFSRAGLSIDLEDVAIRAMSAVLSAMRESGGGPDTSVYLELGSLNLRFDGASTMSLSAIHKARIEGSRGDQAQPAAALSIKILDTGGITPILLPPLPGFEMRLLIAGAGRAGEANATLFFNEERVEVEVATSILGSLKQRLERPALLLL